MLGNGVYDGIRAGNKAKKIVMVVVMVVMVVIEGYVFRLGNLLNIVEKVTGIDYSCYDIPRTPKV